MQYYGGIVMLAADLLPFLKVYAASFFVIPLVRWLWIKSRNAKIDARNEVKLQNAVRRARKHTIAACRPPGRLASSKPRTEAPLSSFARAQDYLLASPVSKQKLLDASRLASVDVISRDRIVYKSNESVEDMDLNDFDERLKSG